ncbi:MAG: DMT family transporter [Chromatiales bacterium]|nr:DMT family transporter [Chromatiales bacterium]
MPLIALLLGASFWGTLWYPLRLLEAHGLEGLWATIIIYGVATVVGVIGLAFVRGTSRGFRLHDALLLMLASGWCNVAFIIAVLEGHVLRVMLLFYLSPLWTVLLARLLLGEVLSLRAWLTMALAVTGALIMLWDPQSSVPWPSSVADWLALSAGFAFALNNVTVRRLQHVSIWHKCLVAWSGVVVVAAAWILLSQSEPPPLLDAVTLVEAVVLGLVGMVLMTFAVIYGVTHLPAYRAAVIMLFELVVAAISSQWLTDESVRSAEWFGGALILLAAWYAARSQAAQEEGRLIHP